MNTILSVKDNQKTFNLTIKLLYDIKNIKYKPQRRKPTKRRYKNKLITRNFYWKKHCKTIAPTLQKY